MGFLRSWAEAEGFLPQYEEHLLRVAKDAQKRNMAPRVRDQLLDDFLFTRQNATGKPDPVFLNKSALSNLDPNDIDIVVIPKSNLPRDGLFSDFDLDVAGGLSEVRVWGDIPLR